MVPWKEISLHFSRIPADSTTHLQQKLEKEEISLPHALYFDK